MKFLEREEMKSLAPGTKVRELLEEETLTFSHYDDKTNELNFFNEFATEEEFENSTFFMYDYSDFYLPVICDNTFPCFVQGEYNEKEERRRLRTYLYGAMNSLEATSRELKSKGLDCNTITDIKNLLN